MLQGRAATACKVSERSIMAAATQRRPRRDPKPRHIDGTAPWAKLENKDPSKHYVLVPMADEMTVANYESIGYSVERSVKDGVKFGGGRTVKPGEVLTMRGLQLMSVSRERHAEIVQYGPDGNTGQDELDEIERSLLDKKRMQRELLRGIDNSGALQLSGGVGEPQEIFA